MSTIWSGPPAVLASRSAIRRALLENAGVPVDVEPSRIDEASVKAAVETGPDPLLPADTASVLAHAKAIDVSERHAGRLVIGADQVLVCDGKRFDKPEDRDAARDQLVSLRGRDHDLITAAACARDGEIVWTSETAATLTMRDFSNDFLGYYMALVGDDITTSVGGYKLEGPGAQLFSAIDGDYFVILGLPLLPLLGFLRRDGALVQ